MIKSLLCFVLLLRMSSLCAQTDSVYLWPHEVPGETKPKSPPVHATVADGTIRIVDVTNPFLAVFLPEKSKKNNKSILVCPGGGYVRLSMHKEGYSVAQWLSTLGYTVFVLQYRIPNKRDGALQDIQRSLKFVRSSAKQYGIAPDKVGAIGFSAGAHLVVWAALTEFEQTYPSQDATDSLSGRPDCMMVIYPGSLDQGAGNTLSPGLKVTSKTVPAFIFQTMDDAGAMSSFALATAMQKANAKVELHMLPEGGHGYGLSPRNKAAEAWPKLLEGWLKDNL